MTTNDYLILILKDLCLNKASAKSLPLKGSHDHLKAQSLKSTKGLNTNHKLQGACFFLAVLYLKRLLMLTTAPFLRRRQDRLLCEPSVCLILRILH
jgi:hypothetical protein